MNKSIYNKLCECTAAGNIRSEEPLHQHTTFRIGGCAEWFITPTEYEQVKKIILLCKEENLPFYVLGNGSNLLVSDKGYRGLILQIYKNMDRIEINDTKIKVQAGALNSKIAKEALKHGLGGLEFAAGIPGTIGGAVVMNAGAYGGEMKDIISEVLVMTPKGEIRRLEKAELELGYRTSIVSRQGFIVLETELELERVDPAVITARMDELKGKREAKQPLGFPSAGSTFKRPEGYFAGKLIMDAGLRGYRVGDAGISEKHCGFVVNHGKATAEEVLVLIQHVQKEVKEQFGVAIETEIKMLGEF